MSLSNFPDPFEHARITKGYGEMNDQNDPVVMVLRHKDLRKCAHNFQVFQSGAVPGRIVVPSEVNIRNTRQIPFEVDPPLHGAYRSVVEEWFRRPLEAEYQQTLTTQITLAVDDMLVKDRIEVVTSFALPVQSRALTVLLNTPLIEAETWISWGTHVFRSEGEPLDASKANILNDYIEEQINKAIEKPGNDFYSVLLAADFKGRKLTREEINGVMNLTFAGGRDTIINAITNTIAHFAEHPEDLQLLRKDPASISHAVEELVRYFSPLTHMGRVVTTDASICDKSVAADSRISLCWASANRDAAVFEKPNEIMLNRKVNPHVGFGFSHHNCLGAPHARQVLKTLLTVLIDKLESIEVFNYEENIEDLRNLNEKLVFINFMRNSTQ